MSNDIQVFEHEELGKLRAVIVDGEPHFFAVDAAHKLLYKNVRDAINRHCKGVVKLDTIKNDGGYPAKLIPEGDLYRMIVKAATQSQSAEIKQQAEKFESWVFDEVLPEIRKTGSYSVQESNQFDLMRQMVDKLEEAHQVANEAKQEVAAVKDTFAQIKHNWRDYVNSVFKSIGNETGDFSTYRTESYIQLERRAKCNLDARLRNLKERKEKAGATKTEVKDTNNLDVIEKDDRLKEIYINIVQEFEAKYLN